MSYGYYPTTSDTSLESGIFTEGGGGGGAKSLDQAWKRTLINYFDYRASTPGVYFFPGLDLFPKNAHDFLMSLCAMCIVWKLMFTLTVLSISALKLWKKSTLF